MSKNIKDYLHLYLWCDFMYKDDVKNGVSFNCSQKLTPTDLIDPNMMKEIRPVLRPLSDMTEEDCDTYNKLNATLYTLADYQNQVRAEAEGVRYLLSKGFDLFGLIESGLAIDKSKLNQPA